jgi:hypothetical protein
MGTGSDGGHPEDFEVDLEKHTARHLPCGTTFSFYGYENLDDLAGPTNISKFDSSPWD